MEWKTIAAFPEHEVSEYGDVRRIKSCRKYKAGYIVKPKLHKRGYLVYSLNNKDVLAHRLVAMAFLGDAPSSKHEVAHGDGTRTNNHRGNLSWKLPIDNQADRKRHGTYMIGEQCTWVVKVNDATANEIRDEYEAGGVRMQVLADKHGISIAQVSRIVNGKRKSTLRRAS